MSVRARGRLRSAARLLVGPTLALLLVLALVHGRAGVALRLYALFVAAVVIAIALGALRRALPPPRPLPPARPGPPARTTPGSLQRLETEIALGVDSAFDYHHRLRKRLRTLADGLLASRRRISLERSPEAARRALGEPAWSLIREGRPAAEDRHARGPTPARLAELVSSLERL